MTWVYIVVPLTGCLMVVLNILKIGKWIGMLLTTPSAPAGR